MRFKLIAPKYHSFIFSGKTVKEYDFDMKKDTKKSFTMVLKPDFSDQTYKREYRFKL